MATHKKSVKLTPKQQLAVNQLLLNPSLKRCAEVTGLSYDYVRELHTKTHIIEALEQGRKRVAERAEIDAAWVLRELFKICERCMQNTPVLDKEGNPTGIYKFDATGALRALENIGKHKAVNAFRPVDTDDKPVDTKWTVEYVHTTKESYEKAVNKQRSQQACQH